MTMKNEIMEELEKTIRSPRTQGKASLVLTYLKEELHATNGEVLAVALMLQETAKKVMSKQVEEMRKGEEE